MIRITGLWKHKDKNGNPYLTGSTEKGGARWMVFPVKQKVENGPDYNLVVAEATRPGTGAGTDETSKSSWRERKNGRDEKPPVEDDEIPF